MAALCLLLMVAPQKAAGAVLAATALLALASLGTAQWQAFHVSTFTALTALVPYAMPRQAVWPVFYALPLLSYGAIVIFIPALRRTVLWLRRGRLTRQLRRLILAAAAVSVVGLMLWYRLTEASLEAAVGLLPPTPTWSLPLLAVAFAAVNAALEEAIFRGILLQAFESAVGAGLVANCLQAALFGALHYGENAVPHGTLAVILTFAYGWLLGTIRQRSRGMLGPWLAHALADVVVFALVVTIAFWTGAR